MVITMDDHKHTQEIRYDDMQDDAAFERRAEDRRKLPSQGFAYISIVGLICRRERNRRKDDNMGFIQTDYWKNEDKDEYGGIAL